ncbi:hypothetical protein GGI55_001743 [Rhizobium leguminosarum]|uniref:hypothetical protein n=1 Tax=Rhizobium TaxID=379 RepID=UPI00161D4342|nr:MULTISPECIES: hypothetical protein [Rhizobium]MBB4297216.1 hypothetical protein [Rhizobium leguminosarum]MBB4415358.1 hypothetical protein [Rhizobium leguminosarum]MBB4431675.1 hypothetical protein [Rhizobium esperanzae]MBB4539709.1 hypothetical protein [Rhizobium leguminosarum]MBB5651898.1 hypothetical protein [Rhizobium leguminosarum]
MANVTAMTSKARTATDRDPVHRAAVSELKTLRVSIEQSTGKWSLTKEKSANTVNQKVK